MSYSQLDALQAEMRACRLCLEAGYWIVPGAVFSGGPEARVMLIGQAPGITEGQVKRPFNAGSGKRLFQWLGEAGWDEDEFRARHYMTSVTKCYPGPNANGKGDRVPSRVEQALCRPFLEREIRLVNPTLMFLVGGLSIKLLYPASVRLNEIVGTAAYFPAENLTADPLNFDLTQAHIVTGEEFSRLSHHSPGGRWVVPLPHPSGASLWHNRPENRALIQRAIALISDIRAAYQL